MKNRFEKDLIVDQCPACKSKSHTPFISTHAMMHLPNDETYHFNKCNTCSSVFLKNPVREEQLEKYYTENYLPYRGAQAWGKFQSFVEKDQKKLDLKRTRFVSKTVKNKDSFSILDVGCGHPSFLKTVKQKTNASCTGVDFSDEGWKNEDVHALHLVKSTFMDFHPEKSYDVITLWHYLEHDYNLQQTALKLYELLKPGGRLIIEVPDYKSFTAKRQQQNWQGWHSPRHLSLFSKEGFASLFPKEKWEIKKHLRYGTLSAFTLWWLGKMEKKQIDWSSPMEKEFWPLVLLKVVSMPLFLFEKLIPMGIQLLVIEKRQHNK